MNDLNGDSLYQIIQSSGPFEYGGDHPKAVDIQGEWRWKDIYSWDKASNKFVKSNRNYPNFYRDLKNEYEKTVESLESEIAKLQLNSDIPNLNKSGSTISKLKDYKENQDPIFKGMVTSRIGLRDLIKNDYLNRIKDILK